MKNKASSRSGLFLMELIVSILFFSLAGAVCVRLFVNSHIVSRNSVELNHALEWTQNVAEVFYGCNGNGKEVMKLFENVCLDGKVSTDSTFYLLFDEEFYPLTITEEDRLGNLSDIHYAYFITVDISNEEELIVCHIRTDKALPDGMDCKEQDSIYELSVNLFPVKEAAYGN